MVVENADMLSFNPCENITKSWGGGKRLKNWKFSRLLSMWMFLYFEGIRIEKIKRV